MKSNLRVLMISLNYPHPGNPSYGVWFQNQIGAYAEYVDIFLFVPVHITPSISKIRKSEGIRRKLAAATGQLKDSLFTYWPPFSSPVSGRYVRYPSIPPKQLFPFSGGILLALRLTFSLLRIGDFNVLHAQGALPEGLAAVLLGKMFRRPSLVTAIGSDIHSIEKNSITHKTTLFVLRHATLITAVSADLRDQIIEMGIPAHEVIVVPNGINPNFMTQYENFDVRKMMNLPERSKVFGFVGRLIAVKDPITLLKAFARLFASRKDVYLIFVGDGDLRESLAEEAERLGLSDHVRLTPGMVPPDQIASYMLAFDYLCVSSIAEGWPNVIFEAMICGKPVIATDVGGNPEAVSSNKFGLIVPAEDPDALASAMDQAMRIDWDSEAIAEYAKSHSWDRVGARYFEIYRQLCRAGTSSSDQPPPD